MDEQTRKRIEAVRSEIAKSDLEPEHKDNLQRHLDHAERCANGTPDKIQALSEAFADKLIRDVRHEVRAVETTQKIINQAIIEHTSLCSIKRRPGLLGFIDRLYDQYPIIAIGLMFYFIQSGKVELLIKALGL